MRKVKEETKNFFADILKIIIVLIVVYFGVSFLVYLFFGK